MNIVVQERGPLKGILRKLANSISLLSNLHTVQIHFRFKDYCDSTMSERPRGTSYHSELVRDCLKGYSYPQIRNLSISSAAHPFMYACPKLKVLKPYMTKYLTVGLDTLDHVPELEVLGHIRMGSETLKGTGAFFNCIYLYRLQVQLQALVKKLPKLRDLTISGKIFEYNQVGHSIKLNFNLLVTHNQKGCPRTKGSLSVAFSQNHQAEA